MKGQVGVESVLLWPSVEEMSALYRLSRPYQPNLVDNENTADLLWPAHLINEQARRREPKNWSIPLAILAFALSSILGFIVGAVQLILIATTQDYGWVTTVYYPATLDQVLFFANFALLFNLAALILAWRAKPRSAHIVTALATGTILELGLIWLSGCIAPWQPHQLALALTAILLVFWVLALMANRQYLTHTTNTLTMKAILATLMAFTVTEFLFTAGYYIEQAAISPTERAHLTATAEAQAAAKLEEVPANLSNLVYFACKSNYSIVYLSRNAESGLFECTNNNDVYSVTDPYRQNSSIIYGSATYLGTTNNLEISQAFPDTKYLFRSLPRALDQDELAIMYAAENRDDLVAKLAPALLEYIQTHPDRTLVLNAFYTSILENIATTKDFVLMSALNTMTMVDSLPNGSTHRSYYNDAVVKYILQPDEKLTAMNELGTTPKLYAKEALIALKSNQHISITIPAHSTFTLPELQQQLFKSFVGGSQY